MSKHWCSWCYEIDRGLVAFSDAGKRVHYWHPGCLNAMHAWLRGHNPPNKPGPEWDEGPPEEYKGIKK